MITCAIQRGSGIQIYNDKNGSCTIEAPAGVGQLVSFNPSMIIVKYPHSLQMYDEHGKSVGMQNI